jgi:hypothetical protein
MFLSEITSSLSLCPNTSLSTFFSNICTYANSGAYFHIALSILKFLQFIYDSVKAK